MADPLGTVPLRLDLSATVSGDATHIGEITINVPAIAVGLRNAADHLDPTRPHLSTPTHDKDPE